MNRIQKAFTELKNDYTYTNAVNFRNFVNGLPNEEVLESVEYLIAEPLVGAKNANMFLHTCPSIDMNNLARLESILESSLTKTDKLDDSYIEILESCLNIIKCRKDLYEENVRLSDIVTEASTRRTLSNKHVKEVDDYIKALVSEDIPEAKRVKMLEELSKSITVNRIPLDIARVLTAVSMGTTVVIYSIGIVIPIVILTPILLLPITLATRASSSAIKSSTKKMYKNAFKAEIKRLDATINSGKGNNDIKQYKSNLENALEILENGELSLLESVMENVHFDPDNYQNEYTILEEAFEEELVTFILNESTVEEDATRINNLIKMNNAMLILEDVQTEILTEGAKEFRKNVHKLSNKAVKATSKIKAKSQHVKQAADAVANTAKRAEKNFNDKSTNVVHKVKNTYRNDLRDEIIEDRTTIKLSRLVKKAIGVGTVTAINPVLGAVTLLTGMAMRKSASEKERRKIINELEEELEIINEKLEDSRGDENKEKKYQLMRIKNKMTKDINRIKYRLKADDKGV